MQFEATQFKKDMKLLESAQRRAIQMGKGLEKRMYEEQLSSLGLLSPEQSRLNRGLMAAYCSLRQKS